MGHNGRSAGWLIAAMAAVSLAGCGTVVVGAAQPLAAAPTTTGPTTTTPTTTGPTTTTPTTTGPATTGPTTATTAPTQPTGPSTPPSTAPVDPTTADSTEVTTPGVVTDPLELRRSIETVMHDLSSFRLTFVVDAAGSEPEFRVDFVVRTDGRHPGMRMTGVVDGLDIDAIILTDVVYIRANGSNFVKFDAKSTGPALQQYKQLKSIAEMFNRRTLSFASILAGVRGPLDYQGKDVVDTVTAHRFTFPAKPGAGDLIGVASMNSDVAALIKKLGTDGSAQTPTTIWVDKKNRLVQEQQVLGSGAASRTVRVQYGDFDKSTNIEPPDPEDVAGG